MDPKTRQHDIVRVGLVIDAVPPGKRAARQHQAINGGGTCSSKKPETTPHVEQRRARAAIKAFGPYSLVSSIDSAAFPRGQRVLSGLKFGGEFLSIHAGITPARTFRAVGKTARLASGSRRLLIRVLSARERSPAPA